jgi:hypothetical protein
MYIARNHSVQWTQLYRFRWTVYLKTLYFAHPNKTPLIFLGRPTAEKYMVLFYYWKSSSDTLRCWTKKTELHIPGTSVGDRVRVRHSFLPSTTLVKPTSYFIIWTLLLGLSLSYLNFQRLSVDLRDRVVVSMIWTDPIVAYFSTCLEKLKKHRLLFKYFNSVLRVFGTSC